MKPIVCPFHGGLLSPYEAVIGDECPMCVIHERDVLKAALPPEDDRLFFYGDSTVPHAISARWAEYVGRLGGKTSYAFLYILQSTHAVTPTPLPYYGA